jgi:hypothetical protein
MVYLSRIITHSGNERLAMLSEADWRCDKIGAPLDFGK